MEDGIKRMDAFELTGAHLDAVAGGQNFFFIFSGTLPAETVIRKENVLNNDKILNNNHVDIVVGVGPGPVIASS